MDQKRTGPITRWLALLMAFALIAAACGGDDDDTTATAEPEPQAEESQPAEEPATEPAAEDEPAEEPAAEPEPEPTATEEPEPTATPEPEPEPTATPEPELSPGEAAAAFAAEQGLPLPDGAELSFYEERDDGSVAIGGIVNSPPPPDVNVLAASVGAEVAAMEFGSVWGAMSLGQACAFLFADYESPTASFYWFYIVLIAGIASVSECGDGLADFRSEWEGTGAPA